MEDYLRVGVITSSHGVRGEVKVFPTTDDPMRFKKLKNCFLDTGKGYRELHIESVKFFKQMVILKFKEFQTIEDMTPYKGKDLLIVREQATPLAEDEFFICDLIGLEVMTDTGERLGELVDVMQTGANDVYVVECADGKEVLLPVIKECVLNVNLEEQKVLVHVMAGLLD